MIIDGKVVEIFQVPVDKDIWPSDFTEMAETRIEVFSVSDPDPYHLVGSGSVLGNVDMDPGSAKN